jgi:hypothetical protein
MDELDARISMKKPNHIYFKLMKKNQITKKVSQVTCFHSNNRVIRKITDFYKISSKPMTEIILNQSRKSSAIDNLFL